MGEYVSRYQGNRDDIGVKGMKTILN